jgi:phospholipid/cholesterol/gamma-HCH transport system substrate-binding protein
VLDAARGVNQGTDLSRLVTDFDSTAAILTKQDGQLGSIMDSMSGVSGVLADERQPLADAVATLPDTLNLTRTGAQALSGTLDRLTATAAADRPAAQQLDPLLQHLDPALTGLRPVLADLHPLLDQARPLVQQLVSTAQQGTRVLADVRGPVLDRLNGPIINTIMSPWHGQAPKYPNGGNGNKFYQELGYLGAHWDNAAKFYDSNGGLVRIQVGVSVSSVLNAPGGLDQLLNALSQLFGPPQQPGTASTPGPASGAPSAPAPPAGPVGSFLPGLLGGTH